MPGGIGSGIDVVAIVDGLMQYQSIGLERLKDKKGLFQYQEKSYTDLKKMINDFHQKLDSFQAILNKNHFKVVSSNESILSVATTSNNVGVGQYNLNITQLAKAHKLSSPAFASQTNALVLSGDLTIETNGNQVTLNLTGAESLEQIRDNINNSENNPGVTASILKVNGAGGVDEYRLILSADEEGTAHAMTISGTAAAGIDLTHELSAAQNAQFTFNGFDVERSSNTISDVLDGVTFHLNGQIGLVNFIISSDIENEEAAITESLQSIIDAYNDVMGLVAKNQSESLLRDSTYSTIPKLLKNVIDGIYGEGDVNRLLDFGVQTAKATVKTTVNIAQKEIEYTVTGQIKLDTTLFSKMIKNNLDDLRSLFTSNSNGLLKAMNGTIDEIENKNIFLREKIIDDQTRDIEDSIYKETARLERVRAHLINQYARVEKIMDYYSNLSNTLDQQLSAMSGLQKK